VHLGGGFTFKGTARRKGGLSQREIPCGLFRYEPMMLEAASLEQLTKGLHSAMSLQVSE
jgi:hypothetical protein